MPTLATKPSLIRSKLIKAKLIKTKLIFSVLHSEQKLNKTKIISV